MSARTPRDDAERAMDALWLKVIGPSTSAALASAKNEFLLESYKIIAAALSTAEGERDKANRDCQRLAQLHADLECSEERLQATAEWLAKALEKLAGEFGKDYEDEMTPEQFQDALAEARAALIAYRAKREAR